MLNVAEAAGVAAVVVLPTAAADATRLPLAAPTRGLNFKAEMIGMVWDACVCPLYSLALLCSTRGQLAAGFGVVTRWGRLRSDGGQFLSGPAVVDVARLRSAAIQIDTLYRSVTVRGVLCFSSLHATRCS